MKAEIAQRWVEALRSGEYTQGKSALAIVEEGQDAKYCCLGVLCDLAMKDGVEMEVSTVGDYLHFDGNASTLPRQVEKWAAVSHHNPDVPAPAGYAERYFGEPRPYVTTATLSSVNDIGYTFDEIADIIEQNKETL